VDKIESYLDRICAELQLNPAEAAEIRTELRAHLQDLISAYSAGGIDFSEAADLALSWFGDPEKIYTRLDSVHRGEAWWLRRLKGLAVGMIVAGLLALIIPMTGPLAFLSKFFAIPFGLEATRLHLLLNGLGIGGIIGLSASGGRGLFVGWGIGSLVWLIEYLILWISTSFKGSGNPETLSALVTTVLLAPLLGGIYGAFIGLGSTRLLLFLSRLRPDIR
jgi:hypothetical protein